MHGYLVRLVVRNRMIYKILSSGSSYQDGSQHELEQEVNLYISKGYVPSGSITVTEVHSGHGIKTIYYQTVVKQEYKNNFIKKLLNL